MLKKILISTLLISSAVSNLSANAAIAPIDAMPKTITPSAIIPGTAPVAPSIVAPKPSSIVSSSIFSSSLPTKTVSTITLPTSNLEIAKMDFSKLTTVEVNAVNCQITKNQAIGQAQAYLDSLNKLIPQVKEDKLTPPNQNFLQKMFQNNKPIIIGELEKRSTEGANHIKFLQAYDCNKDQNVVKEIGVKHGAILKTINGGIGYFGSKDPVIKTIIGELTNNTCQVDSDKAQASFAHSSSFYNRFFASGDSKITDLEKKVKDNPQGSIVNAEFLKLRIDDINKMKSSFGVVREEFKTTLQARRCSTDKKENKQYQNKISKLADSANRIFKDIKNAYASIRIK